MGRIKDNITEGQKRKWEPERLYNVLVQIGQETFKDLVSPKILMNWISADNHFGKL